MKKRNYSQTANSYVAGVLSGSIPASKWIQLAAQRWVDDSLKTDSRWHYDAQRANRVCAWMEMHPHEGRSEGKRFILSPWQVWITCSIFGFVDEDGVRKYSEAFLLCPRGQGKSPWAALVLLWMTFFDGEKSAEGMCFATTEKQAMQVFNAARHYVSEVAAYKRLGVEVAAKSIYSLTTRSKCTPIIGRAKYGSSPYVAVGDEAHQFQDTQQLDNMRTGLAKRINSLLLLVTSAGVSSTENPAYQIQLDCQKMLEGSLENDRIFSALYMADPEVDWTSRAALEMACPNLGVSIPLETVEKLQAEAVRSPAQQNAFRSMYLSHWLGSSSSWINMVAFNACYDPALNDDLVKNFDCWLGSDLASTLDLASTVRLFRNDIDDKPHYYALTRAYLPEARVNAPENAHFQKWVKQGHLTSTPGNSIDYSAIEADTIADTGKYRVKELAYDARYADQYSQRVSEITGTTRVVVPPSPAELSPSMKELEAAVADGRFHHDGHPVLIWCMSNLLTRETGAGNYTMPTKQRPENKIDCAIALLIAMCRARLMPVAATSWPFQPFTI